MTAPAAERIVAVQTSGGLPGSFGPRGAGWEAAQEVEVPLAPTPLEAQPSAYVREAWAARKHGATPSVRAAAAVCDGVAHVRLRWAALNPRPAITDNNVFADACAVMFPLDGRAAVLATMGDPARPVEAWHWRAGTADAFVLRGTGLGTTTRQALPHGVSVEAAWNAGEWAVVFSRGVEADGVPLAAGRVPVAFAVWQGAVEERAGLASHTPEWLTLQLRP